MIWNYQDAVSRRLLLWSALSAATGALLLTIDAPFWHGFGLQALLWGAIDAAIALFGQRSANKRRRTVPIGAETFAREARNLQRVLWINTGLDLLYIAGGLLLALTLGARDPFAAGSGWGVVLQGGFLFLFDLLHAVGVPRQGASLPQLDIFSGPENAPFRIEGGEPAALLIHGFLGTPAEMRDLAHALNEQGWTVEAPLLPGFGRDIATLPERRYDEWLAAARQAADDLLGTGHGPLLIVGFSMGAAVAVPIAAAVHPAGLVLLAPFWWEEQWWSGLLDFFVRPLLPIGFRPLRKVDFSDPRLRAGIGKFAPGVDPDDPDMRAALREVRVPVGLIDQLRLISRVMRDAARQVDAPILVVQGSRDEVVKIGRTRTLLRWFSPQPEYLEADAGHDLTLSESADYRTVERAVVRFAEDIRRQ